MSGKGDTRRSEAKPGAFAQGWDAIDWQRGKTPQQLMAESRCALDVIPAMDHPYAKHWTQPDRSRIVLNDTHAFMHPSALDELADYSCSQPSGVYPGKMWRSSDAYDRKRDVTKPLQWWLCWFDVSEKGDDYCSTKRRKVVLA